MLAQCVAIPGTAQATKQESKLFLPPRSRGGIQLAGQRTKIAQSAAQPPHADTTLMQLFRRTLPVGELASIAKCLMQSAGEHRAQRFIGGHLRLQRRHAGLDGSRHQAAGQPLATLGLAARIKPEAVPLDPPRSNGRQGRRRAAQQLEFKFTHRQALDTGANFPFVECDFHHDATVHANLAPRAPNVGGEDLAERRAGIGQRLLQRGAGCRSGMAREVQRRNARAPSHHDFVLQTLHESIAPCLERLHPAPSFPAQPQGQACGRKAPIRCIEVAGLQAHSLRSCRGDCSQDRVSPGGRDLELQFDFVHGIVRLLLSAEDQADRRLSGPAVAD